MTPGRPRDTFSLELPFGEAPAPKPTESPVPETPPEEAPPSERFIPRDEEANMPAVPTEEAPNPWYRGPGAKRKKTLPTKGRRRR